MESYCYRAVCFPLPERTQPKITKWLRQAEFERVVSISGIRLGPFFQTCSWSFFKKFSFANDFTNHSKLRFRLPTAVSADKMAEWPKTSVETVFWRLLNFCWTSKPHNSSNRHFLFAYYKTDSSQFFNCGTNIDLFLCILMTSKHENTLIDICLKKYKFNKINWFHRQMALNLNLQNWQKRANKIENLPNNYSTCHLLTEITEVQLSVLL